MSTPTERISLLRSEEARLFRMKAKREQWVKDIDSKYGLSATENLTAENPWGSMFGDEAGSSWDEEAEKAKPRSVVVNVQKSIEALTAKEQDIKQELQDTQKVYAKQYRLMMEDRRQKLATFVDMHRNGKFLREELEKFNLRYQKLEELPERDADLQAGLALLNEPDRSVSKIKDVETKNRKSRSRSHFELPNGKIIRGRRADLLSLLETRGIGSPISSEELITVLSAEHGDAEVVRGQLGTIISTTRTLIEKVGWKIKNTAAPRSRFLGERAEYYLEKNSSSQIDKAKKTPKNDHEKTLLDRLHSATASAPVSRQKLQEIFSSSSNVDFPSELRKAKRVLKQQGAELVTIPKSLESADNEDFFVEQKRLQPLEVTLYGDHIKVGDDLIALSNSEFYLLRRLAVGDPLLASRLLAHSYENLAVSSESLTASVSSLNQKLTELTGDDVAIISGGSGEDVWYKIHDVKVTKLDQYLPPFTSRLNALRLLFSETSNTGKIQETLGFTKGKKHKAHLLTVPQTSSALRHAIQALSNRSEQGILTAGDETEVFEAMVQYANKYELLSLSDLLAHVATIMKTGNSALESKKTSQSHDLLLSQEELLFIAAAVARHRTLLDGIVGDGNAEDANLTVPAGQQKVDTDQIELALSKLSSLIENDQISEVAKDFEENEQLWNLILYLAALNDVRVSVGSESGKNDVSGIQFLQLLNNNPALLDQKKPSNTGSELKHKATSEKTLAMMNSLGQYFDQIEQNNIRETISPGNLTRIFPKLKTGVVNRMISDNYVKYEIVGDGHFVVGPVAVAVMLYLNKEGKNLPSNDKKAIWDVAEELYKVRMTPKKK